MIRTQIQFPEPVYLRLKEIAEQLDGSHSEVMRKAAEDFITRFPKAPIRKTSGGFLHSIVVVIFSPIRPISARKPTRHDPLRRCRSFPPRGKPRLGALRRCPPFFRWENCGQETLPPVRPRAGGALHAAPQPRSLHETKDRPRSKHLLRCPPLQSRLGVQRLRSQSCRAALELGLQDNERLPPHHSCSSGPHTPTPHGVIHFATANTKHFRDISSDKVWNPVKGLPAIMQINYSIRPSSGAYANI